MLLYNSEWSPIPGEKHPWALGRPAREAWPEIWHIIEPLFQRVMTTGEATRSRDQLLPMHRHGFTEECYFDYTFSPIRGESGRVEGIFNAVLETTTRVIGERRLRTLRELGAWKTGEARSAEEACQTAAQILAENPHDLAFAEIFLLDADAQRATLAGSAGMVREAGAVRVTVDLHEGTSAWPFQQVADSGKAVDVQIDESALESLSGGAWPELPRRAVVLPMAKSGHTELAGFIVAGISPRLALNDDYRGFLDLLAGHIAAAVASARAYEEERRRAESLAELDRAKTAFFSNISHEFRTPLTLMLGPVEDMLANSGKHATSSDNRQLLEVVQRNGQRLQRLVNSLLDFSRIEAGRVRATYEPTDLASLTIDLASNFRSACDKAGLKLSLFCPHLAEPVFVDREMYEKIVLNLLSNAFKFTFDGEIAVTLCQTGRNAALEVRDTGTGIPAEEMPRLFERFHRVENARGRTHEGSGIGLALVHELVRLHGGSIGATSEIGIGSTFTVTIPLGSDHLPSDRLATGSTKSTTTGASTIVKEVLRWLPDVDLSGKPDSALAPPAGELPLGPASEASGVTRPRILVADDNADMRQYVERLLHSTYDVETVQDGEAALAAVWRQTPDLILSDVMMPQLDGFGLLREVRNDPRSVGVPFILLSARAGEESRVEGMQAGADDYLVKPFSARELLARVESLLQINRLRQESERAIRQSEAKFRSMADNAPAMLWVTDPSGYCTYLSALWYQFTGRPVGNDVGTGWLEAIHPDDLDQTKRIFLKANQEQVPFSIDYRLLRHDGHYRWAVDAGLPRFDGDNFQGFVGCVIDVHERKSAEDANRQLVDTLRHADQRKDEFLATLAHELRNPLAPIRNGLQIMRLAKGDTVATEHARSMMERQLGQMVHLVDDLLDLSRISRGKIELRKERIELAKAIQQAIETSRPDIEQSNHELLIDVPPLSIYVDADATRLAQVFSNLLNNAAKYTERGGRIRLALQQSGNEAIVTVRDNGIGIPAHMLPHVFDMFTQVDRNLERSQGGLGIGLSIVKRLVRMHGGTVEAKSDGHGMGSEFVVRLPVVLSVVTSHSRDDETIIQPSSRRRVLVVDDNRDAAVSLALMLQLMGNDTKTAHDGLEALDVAAAFRPDLILLDIGMPKMNGYDTARHIREQSWGKGIVLVALTGWGQEEDRRKSDQAGFNSHMVKPIEPAALEKLLASLKADAG